MKKFISCLLALLLLPCFAGCAKADSQAAVPQADKPAAEKTNFISAEGKSMKIIVQSADRTVVFQLNDSQAAKDLYAQLPLTLPVKPYSDNEMTFYPPKKLNTSGAPAANAGKGSLCYFGPWDDVVMFYAHFGSYRGLYSLGKAISGKDDIQKLSGKITISVYDK